MAERTWQLLNDGFNMTARQYYYGHIYADPVDANTVYTFCAKYFYKSTDGGRTYTEVQTPHADYHDLWIDPKNPLRMVNGSDGGAAVTFNGGRTWSSLDNQPTAQFYAVVTDNSVPYRIYGSQQDNTTVSIASRTSGAGITERDWYPVGGGESGYLAPTSSNPPVVYGGSYWGHLTRYDERTGESRNITVWPDYNGGRMAAEVKYRFQWTFPIIVSPHDDNTVYAGAQFVLFRTTNGGQSWDADQPRPHAQRQGEAARRTPRRVLLDDLHDCRIARDQRRHLDRIGRRAGARDAKWRTRLAERDAVRSAAVHAREHHRGIAARRRRRPTWRSIDISSTTSGRTSSRRPTTVNRGRRLRPASPNAASSAPFARIRNERVCCSRARKPASTTHSTPARTGSRFSSICPVVPITDLAIKDDDLIAATQGRAFWVLDDITPLHGITDAVYDVDGPPVSASRRRSDQTRGFGRGAGVAGQNPPAGAIVTYLLGARAGGDAGVPGRARHGDQEHLEQRIATDPPATPGLHRYAWDMRYADAHGIEGGTFLAGGSLRGPVAVPGAYQVRMKTGSQILTQPLRIVADPKSGANDG